MPRSGGEGGLGQFVDLRVGLAKKKGGGDTPIHVMGKVRMGDFKKWGGVLVMRGNDFEMGG